jgi:hypothetical protein
MEINEEMEQVLGMNPSVSDLNEGFDAAAPF